MTTATTTALDIITDAALFAGIGDVYNAVDPNNAAANLRFLNYLLDSCSEEEYSVFDIVEGTFPLVSGTQIYTLGPGGVYTAARPQQITTVNILDSSSVTHPVTIIGVNQWGNDITYKPAPGRPEYVFFNYNATTIDASFWPLPSFTGDVCHFFYSAVLTQFATLAGSLTTPPGYAWWMITELGGILAEVNEKPLTPGKVAIAGKARRNMRALNADINILGLDVPISDRTTFNIYTGNNNP
jgi:hypothetical protein